MAKKTKKENAEIVPVGSIKQQQKTEVATLQSIQNSIMTIRGQQVMLDRDLAVLYGVETKKLNQAVKRNIERFPENFMFQLSKDEFEDWRSQIVTSNLSLKSQNVTSRLVLFSDNYVENDVLKSQLVTSNAQWKSQFATSNSIIMGARKRPYAFTEQGVAMLSAVLRSETAVAMSIKIIEAFVAMRRFLVSNEQLFRRMETMEFNQLEMRQQLAISDKRHETNEQILSELMRRFDEGKEIPTQGIFYNGQIFDAYVFVNDLIRSAKERIVLIDNYVDDTVLKRLDKREAGVTATIYTRKISEQLQIDLDTHNHQYAPIRVQTTDKPHDRFLIIDREMYLIGASIKDLGKKIFGFTKMEEPADELLKRLED